MNGAQQEGSSFPCLLITICLSHEPTVQTISAMYFLIREIIYPYYYNFPSFPLKEGFVAKFCTYL